MGVAVFDLGGVLLSDATKTAFRVLERELGIPAEHARELWELELRIPLELGAIHDNDLWAMLSDLSARADPGAVKRIFLAEFRELDVGTAAMDALIQVGWTVALATNHVSAWLEEWGRRYAWFDRLHPVYCSADLAMRKPERAFFEHVLGDLGTPNPIFVDDDPQNVAVARVVGFDGRLATDSGAWANDLIAGVRS